MVIPAIGKIGVFDFLLGERWKPGNNIYGILPFILGSIYVTAGAVLIGVPIGICTAVFMAKFCPPKLYKFMKPAVELLAGIPSVVYGFFGMVVVVPFVRDFFGIQLGFGGDGSSMFTASVMLGIMGFCLQLSVWVSLQFVQCRRVIMKVLLLLGQHMKEVYFVQYCLQQNQA